MTSAFDNAVIMSTPAEHLPQGRAFWLIEPGRGELRNTPVRTPDAGEVCVQARYSGISRGTESLVFQGLVPPSEQTRMRAPFQEGEFSGPLKYGYASVGRVIAGQTELLGRDVFCLYPHQSHYTVPADAVEVVPSSVPAARAVLAANMETALNGLWDSQASAGDRITVVGGGVVGLLIAWLAGQLPGSETTVVDVNPARRDPATALGVGFSLPEEAAAEQDVVFHTSASADGLNTALGLAAIEARVIEMSWYGTRRPSIDLGRAFHARRLQLISSQVGQLPADRRARWSYRRRLRQALALLEAPALDALISGESALDELPDLMPRLCASSSDSLCHRISYPA